MNEIKEQDVWIMFYKVPNKEKYFRPVIIIEIKENEIYGIPITSYNENRFKKQLGDMKVEFKFLNKKSIIKPYQIIKIDQKKLSNKVGKIPNKIFKSINNKLKNNYKQYLAFKNGMINNINLKKEIGEL